jgi:hypothetical protein
MMVYPPSTSAANQGATLALKIEDPSNLCPRVVTRLEALVPPNPQYSLIDWLTKVTMWSFKIIKLSAHCRHNPERAVLQLIIYTPTAAETLV